MMRGPLLKLGRKVTAALEIMMTLRKEPKWHLKRGTSKESRKLDEE